MTQETPLNILPLLLRPVARFCLRHGLHVQDLLEATKQALLQEAAAQMIGKGLEVNASRLSAATGIHRRDVGRIADRGEVRREPLGLVSRILGQWQHDKRFCKGNGTARELSCGAEESEFHELVRAVSQDLHAGTILSELERLGVVERRARKGRTKPEGETVRLCKTVFVPEPNHILSYKLLAQDATNLFDAVQENIDCSGSTPHLHGTTDFDNIRRDALPAIRQWLYVEGSKFHSRVRSHLSRFDLDISQPKKRVAGGCRVSLTTFSLSSEPRTTGDDEDDQGEDRDEE